MAITFGNSGYDNDQASGTTSYNNNGDFLVVNVNSTSNDVTGVTYAGVAMTQQGTTQQTSWSSRYHSTWILTNPAQGANDIVTTGGANWQFIMFSVSGVDQTTPTSGDVNGGDQSGTNPSLSVTTTVDNAYPVAIGQIQQTATAGTNTTLVVSESGGANYVFRSTNAVSPAGAFTIQTTASSGGYRLHGFGINPAPVVTFIPRNFLTMGVGK